MHVNLAVTDTGYSEQNRVFRFRSFTIVILICHGGDGFHQKMI